MIVKKVSLKNFRIHDKYELNCDRKTTLIVGENGLGKTSVLEAIYLAMRGKSFKAADKDILRRGADFYRVDLEYEKGEEIVVAYDGLKKQKFFVVKDKKTARLPVKAKYPVVLFVPEDLHLVATSPMKRRDYFDKIWSQLDENYYTSLLKYQKIIKQRNELLKSEFLQPASLFSWNVLLAKYGTEIWQKRREYVGLVNLVFSEVYNSIADIKDLIGLKILEEEMNESKYLAILERNFEKDKVMGFTSFGVHKDNYEFWFNDSLADGSASRGETRSIILALKFIEAKMMQEFCQKKPLILLDDVFSELDMNRQRCLVKNFSEHQIILTSVQDVEF